MIGDLAGHEEPVDQGGLAGGARQQEGQGQDDSGGRQVHEAAVSGGARELRRQVQAEFGGQRLRVAGPADRHGRGRHREFQHEIPADDPGGKPAQAGAGVGVSGPRLRDHGGQFGVAQADETAGDPADHEGEAERRAGILRRRRAGEHEDARADRGPESDGDEAGGREVSGEAAVRRERVAGRRRRRGFRHRLRSPSRDPARARRCRFRAGSPASADDPQALCGRLRRGAAARTGSSPPAGVESGFRPPPRPGLASAGVSCMDRAASTRVTGRGLNRLAL